MLINLEGRGLYLPGEDRQVDDALVWNLFSAEGSPDSAEPVTQPGRSDISGTHSPDNSEKPDDRLRGRVLPESEADVPMPWQLRTAFG